MYLDVRELATRKIRIRKSYSPGSLDFRTDEYQQVGPLDVRATAELLDGQIRIFGQFQTRLELVCSRCLDPVTEEISKEFDLCYRPVSGSPKEEEARLREGDTEVGFYRGKGMFLGDVLTEQVSLLMPMKVICRNDCRGLCPHCGANLNHEECRCERHAADPRFAPLARLKQDWSKKH